MTPRRPRLMRDKTVFCDKCQDNRSITVDLTAGVVTNAQMPARCMWPKVCTELMKDGVFDRPFGEGGKRIA